MSRYQVDAAALASTAAAVQARAATIANEVAGMQRQLADLQSDWQGAASGRFAAIVTDWGAAAAHVDRSLAQITAAMQTAARTYDEAENQAARMFAG